MIFEGRKLLFKEKQALMNAGPRKVLGYKTPAELFENILRECCI